MLQITGVSGNTISTVHGSFRINEETRKATSRYISSSHRRRSTGNLQHILVIDRGAKARRLIPEI